MLIVRIIFLLIFIFPLYIFADNELKPASQIGIQHNNQQTTIGSGEQTKKNYNHSEFLKSPNPQQVSQPHSQKSNTKTTQNHHWYNNPWEILLTIFNGLLAIFTWCLWRSTNRLWASTEKTATAAKESAVALKDAERAHIYVFVRRWPDIDLGQPIVNIEEGLNRARITAMNFGKTPAVIVKINYELGAFTDIEIDNKLSEMKTKPISKIPPEVIAITRENEKEFTAECMISTQDEQDIGISIEYACFGRINYRDVFGTIHEITFCWKDNGVFFIPDVKRCKHK